MLLYEPLIPHFSINLHTNQKLGVLREPIEDASLEYTGINKNAGQDVGLYDTVLTRKDYEESFMNEP